MSRQSTLRQRLADIMANGGAALQAAFLQSIRELRKGANVEAIVRLLQAGDIDRAIDAINLDPAVYRAMDAAIAQAYTGGGVAAVTLAPALRMPDIGRVVVRFDTRNVRAETQLRELAGGLVTRINAEQRAALRSVLENRLLQGSNPRTTALDVVGRINRATGRREGGLLGLSAPQVQAVENARAALLSGDVDGMRRYLLLARRNNPGQAGNWWSGHAPGAGGAAGPAIDGNSYVTLVGSGDIRGPLVN